MSKLVHKNGSISEAEAKGFCVHVCTRETHSEHSDTPYKVLAEHSCWRGTSVNLCEASKGTSTSFRRRKFAVGQA